MNVSTFFKTICLSLLATAVFMVDGIAKSGDIIDPATLKEKIILTPEARGRIEFDQNGNELTNLRWIADSKEEKGIVVSFINEPHDKFGGCFCMLNVQNFTSQKLTFRAAIRTVETPKNFRETSVIVPLNTRESKKGFSYYGMWPDNLQEVLLFGFAFVD